ncbi:MAG: cation transporter [Candidatus Omnitrophota bacterium]
MQKSTFKVIKMDCPGEEQLIRMKLQPRDGVKQLEFDLSHRLVSVYHEGEVEALTQALAGLELNSTLLKTEEVPFPEAGRDEGGERKLLKAVLAINLGFFLLEAITGFFAHSMGLVADSLDMLADAIVYALSLSAVGMALAHKKKIAKISGYFQLALAIFGFLEVIRRFLGFAQTPVFQTMIFISILALMGNSVSLLILRRSKSREAHMKASWIFTSNDVLANAGVIIAGIMVYFTHSRYPDLIVGSIIFLIVARGSYRIMQLSK